MSFYCFSLTVLALTLAVGYGGRICEDKRGQFDNEKGNPLWSIIYDKCKNYYGYTNMKGSMNYSLELECMLIKDYATGKYERLGSYTAFETRVSGTASDYDWLRGAIEVSADDFFGTRNELCRAATTNRGNDIFACTRYELQMSGVSHGRSEWKYGCAFFKAAKLPESF